MLPTFGARTVVIWRRWTSLVRPCGWRITMSMRSRPAKASIAAEPVSPEVAPTIVTRASRVAQHMVEQPAEHLQRHVLEGERRAVEQLLHEQTVSSWTSGHDGGMAEAGIGVAAHAPAASRRDCVADERLHHPRGECSDTAGRASRASRRGETRPGFGHIETAIFGEAGQQHLGEIARRCLSASGDVAHFREPSSSRRRPNGGPGCQTPRPYGRSGLVGASAAIPAVSPNQELAEELLFLGRRQA